MNTKGKIIVAALVGTAAFGVWLANRPHVLPMIQPASSMKVVNGHLQPGDK